MGVISANELIDPDSVDFARLFLGYEETISLYLHRDGGGVLVDGVGDGLHQTIMPTSGMGITNAKI